MSASLDSIRIWMTRYVMSSYLAFGVVGNLINVFMFTRKNPLRNPCNLYIIALSISHIINASWGIIPTLYNLDNIDPSTYSYAFCKLRLYTLHSIIMIGRTLLVAACIDRYAVCSNHQSFHALSNPKVALRIVIGIVVTWPCINIYLPFVTVFTQSYCIFIPSFNIVWAVYTVVVPGVLTPGLMIVFGFLAVRQRNQLQTRLNGTRNYGKKRDYTLTIMLFSEVLVYLTATSLFPATTFYRTVTIGVVKSVQRQQIESFISFIGGTFLLFLNPSATFYIFIAVSRSYRAECKRELIRFYMRLIGRPNQISTVSHANDTIANRQNETFF